MRTQKRMVNDLYKNIYRVTKKNIQKLGLHNSNDKLSVSDKTKLKILDKSLGKSTDISSELKSILYQNMQELCKTTIDEVEEQTGIKIQDEEEFIQDIIDSVVLGLIYNTNWTLSDATDKISYELYDLVSEIIKDGIASGKSEEEIVEDILAVINPEAQNPSYENKRKKRTIYTGKVDYPANRLVHTTLQHVYQKAIVNIGTYINALEEGRVMIRWISALLPNTCDICEARHDNLYTPEDLPLDHPNGQCSFVIEIY